MVGPLCECVRCVARRIYMFLRGKFSHALHTGSREMLSEIRAQSKEDMQN